MAASARSIGSFPYFDTRTAPRGHDTSDQTDQPRRAQATARRLRCQRTTPVTAVIESVLRTLRRRVQVSRIWVRPARLVERFHNRYSSTQPVGDQAHPQNTRCSTGYAQIQPCAAMQNLSPTYVSRCPRILKPPAQPTSPSPADQPDLVRLAAGMQKSPSHPLQPQPIAKVHPFVRQRPARRCRHLYANRSMLHRGERPSPQFAAQGCNR